MWCTTDDQRWCKPREPWRPDINHRLTFGFSYSYHFPSLFLSHSWLSLCFYIVCCILTLLWVYAWWSWKQRWSTQAAELQRGLLDVDVWKTNTFFVTLIYKLTTGFMDIIFMAASLQFNCNLIAHFAHYIILIACNALFRIYAQVFITSSLPASCLTPLWFWICYDQAALCWLFVPDAWQHGFDEHMVCGACGHHVSNKDRCGSSELSCTRARCFVSSTVWCNWRSCMVLGSFYVLCLGWL